MPQPYEQESVIQWCQLLSKCFNLFVARPIVSVQLQPRAMTEALYNFDSVILSHQFSTDGVPRFCFANAAAQKLFGYSWGEFTGMKSSESAKPDGQEDREALLTRANNTGFVDNYSGVRIAKSGACFPIEGVILWDIYNEKYAKIGQAAMFEVPPTP